jgi:hypothetical protein
MRAVENKDIMFLMEVRDRAFHVRFPLPILRATYEVKS